MMATDVTTRQEGCQSRSVENIHTLTIELAQALLCSAPTSGPIHGMVMTFPLYSTHLYIVYIYIHISGNNNNSDVSFFVESYKHTYFVMAWIIYSPVFVGPRSSSDKDKEANYAAQY